MANRNNLGFQIPIALIVLAYVFCWPVGVVLTILRVISSSNKTQNYGHPTGADMRAQNSQMYTPVSSEAQRAYRNAQQQAWPQAQPQPQQRAQTGANTTNPYYQQQMNRQAAASSAQSDARGGLIAGGVITAIVAGFFALISAMSFTSDGFGVVFGFASFFALAAAAFFVGACYLKNRKVELNRIRNMIGNKESFNLSKLASASGKNLKKIRKQLQKMIDRGEFGPTAYIDLGTNNFMRNPDAEPDDPEGFDYRTVYGDLFAKKKEEAETAQEPEDDSDQARFNRIIGEIRRLNAEIRDPQVSERIDRIEAHTRHIFDYVTDHPEAMPQIRTFMNYYLPTTLKLLESYSRIERVGVAGENMKKSKENIESILDLLVVGFEQQIDQLFRNESIDITSDISVLETMMQKDGLNGKSDFDITSYTDGYSDEITDEIGGTAGAAARQAPKTESNHS